ncbi:MAG: HNH endonuclease [Solirubrobacteraceae bacterium]
MRRDVLDIRFDTQAHWDTDANTAQRKLGMFKGADPIRRALGLSAVAKPDPTYGRVVETLVAVETNLNKPVGWSKPRWKAAKSKFETFTNRLTAIYKRAGTPLQGRVGPFCSFCEQRLAGEIQVEHLVPKGTYTHMWLPWNNFALACGPCNTSKLGKPNWATSSAWGPFADAIARVVAIRDHYLWVDTSGALAYQLLKPVLWWEDAGTWRTVDHPVHPDTRWRSRNPDTREVRADVHSTAGGAVGPATHLNVPVQVEIAASGGGANLAKAQRTMTQWDPNRVVPNPDDSLYDQRMFNRTQAWVKLVPAARLAVNANVAAFNGQWDTFLLAAEGWGQFSVVLRILELLNAAGIPDPTGAAPTVMQRFLTDVNGQNIYPGTATAGLP